MTEEGKKLLDDFMERKERYESLKDDFGQFAASVSQSFKKKKAVGNCFVILGGVLLVLFLVFSLLGAPRDFCLLVFAVSLFCMIVTYFSEPPHEMMKDLTARFLKSKNYPEEDKELAYRVFSDAKVYSDLPELKTMVASHLISSVDLDDLELDVDIDFDFDGDD